MSNKQYESKYNRIKYATDLWNKGIYNKSCSSINKRKKKLKINTVSKFKRFIAEEMRL